VKNVTSSGIFSKSGERLPRLLVVQSDSLLRDRLGEWLQDVRMAHTASAREAGDILRDAAFIDSAFDGMLVESRLPDAAGYRVVQDFRFEFPGAPIAMLGDVEDLCLSVWARARGIQVLRKPLQRSDLESWVATLHALQGLSA
jgi:DNA-binding response OmpR family regulator